MRNAFIAELQQLVATDPRIMLITADLGFGVFDQFAKDHPRQFLNAGVAEQNMTGLATGLAMEGRIVFTYSIANFPSLRCLEQIRNDAAYHDANVKVVSIGSGFSYGALGISHHATEDIAIVRALPGLTVVSPGDEWEVRQATRALISTPGTCYLRLDKSKAPPNHRPDDVFEIGKARVVRAGTDLTIAVTGGILEVALTAAAELAREHKIETRILSVHTAKPLDVAALAAAARETGGLLALEEHTVEGGLGGAIAESLLELGAIPRAFMRVGLRAGFSSAVGGQEYLRAVYGLDQRSVVASALKLLKRQ
ncbi:MAG TPA: transketolase C-terminal domain-containing protein [Steroidobacteraceae bacterium]|nr:transketolase C-terminal domain-containing protein [Steroidobacteraceae bacterium]